MGESGPNETHTGAIHGEPHSDFVSGEDQSPPCLQIMVAMAVCDFHMKYCRDVWPSVRSPEDPSCAGCH